MAGGQVRQIIWMGRPSRVECARVWYTFEMRYLSMRDAWITDNPYHVTEPTTVRL